MYINYAEHFNEISKRACEMIEPFCESVSETVNQKADTHFSFYPYCRTVIECGSIYVNLGVNGPRKGAIGFGKVTEATIDRRISDKIELVSDYELKSLVEKVMKILLSYVQENLWEEWKDIHENFIKEKESKEKKR